LPTAWYLDFSTANPSASSLPSPGKRFPPPNWYLTYTVTNNTGKELNSSPTSNSSPRTAKIFRGDRQHPPARSLTPSRRTPPTTLLVSAAQITAPLHQGEDQAKDGVAIWEEPLQRAMGAFTIYVGGLNSEFTPAVDDKGARSKDAEGKPITLRKALELNFVIWGDEIKPEKDDVQVKPERWVMR